MKVALVLLVALALTGCGGHKTATPTQVARAWSAALDRNDNEAAGLLFADGAQIVQDGTQTLQTHADAVRWNASLPCGGRIVTLELRSKTQVLVVFVLSERPHHTCDAPGGTAAAVFQVRNGKIVLWHQTDVPPQLAPGTFA
jgi:limonene-1,2-epoxide hydrolase